MRKIFYGLLLIPFWIVFTAIMVGFHPVFALTHRRFPRTFDWLIRILNHAHNLNLRLTTFTSIQRTIEALPNQSKPCIIVSNHQNIYDIALLITTFTKTTLLFIAKKQLGKGIPTVSFLLRNRNGILIDRDSGRDALSILTQFAPRVTSENLTCVIFPEGTRSRDGVVKPFKTSGLKKILESNPSAQFVPVGITGSSTVLNPKFFPFFHRIHIKVFKPIQRSDSVENDILAAEQQIRGFVE